MGGCVGNVCWCWSHQHEKGRSEGPARPGILLVHSPLRPSRPKLRLLRPQRHKTVMVRCRRKL